MRITPILLLVVSFTVILLAGCGGGPPSDSTEQSETQDKAENKTEDSGEGSGRGQSGSDLPQGIPVRVEEVQTGSITDGVESNSTVEAEQEVDIYSRVTGVVISLKVEEGDQVRKGEILCSLEDEELELNEARSRAQKEKLKLDLERTKELVEKKILTETDLKNAQFEYDQAVISWQQDKANLEYADIRSTINGVIYERVVQLGDKITPSNRLFSMFNTDSLAIHVYIPENDYFQKIADNIDETVAEIVSESLPDKVFYGSISRVAPVVNPETNTIKVTLKYRDSDRILKPGMYVKVRLVVDTHENAVLIPKNAILFDNNLQYVFVVRDGEAVRVPLKVGYREASYVESTEGIDPGEQVVVVGQAGLKDGSQVRVVENQ